MSADNGVYILQCKDQFRVKHLSAIGNISWSFLGCEETDDIVPSRVIEMFGDCKYTRSKDMALKIASYILEKIYICEYGTSFIKIDKTWSQIYKEGIEYAKKELEYLESEKQNNLMNNRWDYAIEGLKKILKEN